MRVVLGTAADIPAIRAIALATWPIAYRTILSPEQLAYMLECMYSEKALHAQLAAGHLFLLLEGGSGAVGFAGFEHHYNNTGATRLHKLYVLPTEQGTGGGKQLLSAVEQAAVQVRDTTLELNVNRFNPAKGFYEKNGFHVERDEVIDIGEGYVMDDHVMRRPLQLS